MDVRPPIAVVGVSALFPDSPDAPSFWRNIAEGADLLSEVPESHWRIEDYFHSDPDAPDRMYARRGGFLPYVDFVPSDFGVPPKTVPAIDTAQLLALAVAKQVLEDVADGDFSHMDRDRVSVVLGVASATELVAHMSGRLQAPVWERALRGSGITGEQLEQFKQRIADAYTPWQADTFPGLLGNVVAGRIANRFDLGGTNCVVDAACASSLAALQIALNELYLGDSEMVITGGVDALNDILMFMCFAKVTALSPSGDCRPFADNADGTMLGEGLAMLALKRLEDAERDGDPIYAVIRGLGSSSDGRAKSIYAPRPSGQAQALRRAYDAAGYGPDTVGLIEAHGTATKAGDIAEFTALREVFDDSGREDRQWCAIGSVKSQVGHTKAAAGACGLFKAVMALHHKTLPPTIKVDQPNPALDIGTSPFYLSTQSKPWIADDGVPRRASVSSFGFGGTNFHVALEEYTGSGRRPWRHRSWKSELVVLEAGDAAALADKAARLSASLKDDKDMLCYIARATQESYDAGAKHRLALVADDVASLRSMLDEAAGRLGRSSAAFASPRGYYYSAEEPGPVALLFPGQGSQYLGMGADVPRLFDGALGPWENARTSLVDADSDLHQIVWPKTAFTEAERRRQAETLTSTQWAQPAIGAHSLSLLRIVRALEIDPIAVGGHSFGEVVALCAAGVFDEEAALRVAHKRGVLMAEAARIGEGTMCAVSAPHEIVCGLLQRWELPVVIANHNSPTQVIVSGAKDAVLKAMNLLSEVGIQSKQLNVATAFHSHLVAGAVAPFADFLDEIPFGTPAFPVYANATAAPYGSDADTMRVTLGEQIAQPVRFLEMVRSMWAAGARTFVEVGPDGVLTNLVGTCLEGLPHRAVALDRKNAHGIRTLWLGLAQLVAAGVPMNFESLWADYRVLEDPRTRPEPKLVLKINGANYGKPRLDDTPAMPYTPVSAPAPANVAIQPAPLVPQQIEHRPVPAATPAAASVAVAVGADLVADMLQVVADKTGYPVEMLELSMALEADLGIDSIKRVEILSAVQQRVPSLPEVETSAMAELKTLQEIVDYLNTLLPAKAPSSNGAVNGGVNGNGNGNGQRSGPPLSPVSSGSVVSAPVTATAVGTDLVADMLQVVADKTGYPVEMLELSMALEADLGIDSIKRVEILSAVQQRVPSLPEVETSAMAELKTLQEIVDYLNTLLPAKAPSSNGAVNVAVNGNGNGNGQRSGPPLSPVSSGSVVSAPVTATAVGTDLVADMLQVVADKTGYPVEMLELSMALEADLGIDSIKRVEILSAVQQRVPSLPEVETSAMAELKTLQEIVDYLNTLLPTRAPTLDGAVNGANGNGQHSAALLSGGDRLPFDLAGVPVARHSVRAIAAPAQGMGIPGLQEADRLEIVGGPEAVSAALQTLLRSHGINAVVADVASADATHVLQLGGLASTEGPDRALDVNRRVIADALRVAPRMEQSGGAFITVQDTGGTFGLLTDAGPRAWAAGAAALTKVAALEWPNSHTKAIDVDTANRSPQQIAELIADEILFGGAELEVGLGSTHGRVTVATYESQISGRVTRLGHRDVVLVSGGARGVTAASVIAMARATQATFVLIGRSALDDEPPTARGLTAPADLKRALLTEAQLRGEKPTPRELEQQVQHVLAIREIRATMSAVEQAGARVAYHVTDVRDTVQLGALLDRVRTEAGPITGLVHGAGVVADAYLSRKTVDQFDRVFGTKVGGLRALLDATADDPLKLILLFSSAAARGGNVGQADYAMANEVVNQVALAERTRRPGCLVRALGWGPWEAGMVTPALKKLFESRGIKPLRLDDGAAAFVAEAFDSDVRDASVLLGDGVAHDGLPHPLPETGRSVRVVVDAASYPYLDGHRVQQQVVLPVVQVAEWFVGTAEACRPGQHVERLGELQVIRGVPLHGFDGGGDVFTVQCLPGQDEPHRLRLLLLDAAGTARYAATAEMSSSPRDLPPVVANQWDAERSMQQPRYGEGALFHSGAFHVLEGFAPCGPSGAVARLHGLTKANWPQRYWATDPAALDGCLQVGFLWSLEQTGRRMLPMRINELMLYRGGPADGELWCYLDNGKATSNGSTYDLRLTDAEGSLIAELRGVEMYPYGGKPHPPSPQ